MNQGKVQALRTLKIARGNLNATIDMLEDDRYCVDVSNQILAVISLLKKGNEQLLRQHLEHCVLEAFDSDDQKLKEEKIDEVILILSKVGK